MGSSKIRRFLNRTNLAAILAGLFIAISALGYIINDSLNIQSESLPSTDILGEMTEDNIYSQRFVCTEDGLTKIRLLTATYARTNEGTVDISLDSESGKHIQDWSIDASVLPDNRYYDLTLDNRITESNGKVFFLTVTTDSKEGSAPTAYTTNYGGSAGLAVNGEERNCSLCFMLEYEVPASSAFSAGTIAGIILILILVPLSFIAAVRFFPVSKIWILVFTELAAVIGAHRFLRHTSPSVFTAWVLAAGFAAFCILWTLGSVILYRLIFVKKIPVHKLAVIVLTLFSVITIFFLTPGTGNDEQFHYAFAYKYANIYSFKGIADPKDEDGDYLIYMRTEDAELLSSITDVPIYITEGSYRDVAKNFSLFSKDNSLQTYKINQIVDMRSFKSNNVPLGYIASGLGVALARLLHLGAVPTFYMGRFFNAALFIFFVYLAIKITPVGKETLFVLSLLPMVLQQCVTYSYDSFIIGIVFLFTAMTAAVFSQDTKLTLKQFIILGVLAFCVAISKFVYAPLIFIVLALPSDRFNIKNPKAVKTGVIAGIIVCGITAVTVLQYTRSIFKYFIPSYVSDGTPFMNIIVKYEEMLQMTAIKNSDFYIHSMVAYPGWYQIYVPVIIVSTFYLLLIFSLVRGKDEKPFISTGTKVFGVVLILISCLLITLPMAAKYTDPGSETVDSIQGRYFLPLVPVILMGLRTKHIKADESFQGKVLWGAGFMSFLFYAFCFLTLFNAI